MRFCWSILHSKDRSHKSADSTPEKSREKYQEVFVHSKSAVSMDPNPSTSTHVSVIYKIFLLWFEPFAAASATVQTLFTPKPFLEIITPARADIQKSPTPVESLLLVQLGSMYLYFAFLSAVLLRYVGSQRLDIWRLVVFGQTLSDIGHLHGLWLVARLVGAESVFWTPTAWRTEDIMNIALTWFGFGLRIAFLAGIGVKSGQ